jgi:hypothetical protein
VGKAVGILLMVIGIWVGVTVYLEGVDEAFGGAFAFFSSTPAGSLPEDEEGHRPVTRRAAHAFQRAYDRSEGRVEDALEQPGSEEYSGEPPEDGGEE